MILAIISASNGIFCLMYPISTEKHKEIMSELIRRRQEKQNGGFSLVLRELQRGEESARTLLCTTGSALMKAFRNEEDIPIAVLAALVSGNPHYLDRGSTPGNLFMQGLCFMQDREYPKSAVEWKKRLLELHILPDDISRKRAPLENVRQ